MKQNITNHRLDLRLVGLLMLAFVLRLGIGVAQGASIWQQGDQNFWRIGVNIVQTGTYSLPPYVPTAMRVPVYPGFLALCYWLFHSNTYLVIAANALVNTAVVAMTYHLGCLIFGKRVGFVAGCAIVFYPYLVWQSGHIIDTGMLSLLLLCLVYAILRAQQTERRHWAIVAGVFGGLAYLTRSVVGPFLLLAAFWWLLTRRRRSRTTVMRVLLVLLVAGICVLPWPVRNAVVFHRLVLTENPGGWGTLWRGNNPLTFEVFPQYPPDSFWPYEHGHAAAAGSSLEAWWTREAVAYIRTHPVSFIAGAVRKALLLWDWYLVPRSREMAVVDPMTGHVVQAGRPRSLSERMLYTLPYVGMLLFAIPGLASAWRTHRQPTLLLCLLLLSWTCMYAVLYPVTRYRMPVEPFVIILAGYGLTRCGSGIFARWGETRLRKAHAGSESFGSE